MDEIYQAIYKTKEKPPFTTSKRGQLTNELFEDFIEMLGSEYIQYKKHNLSAEKPYLVYWEGWHGTNPIID